MIDNIIIFTNQVSRYIIPFLLVGIPFYGLIIKKVKVYESFVDGAKDGFDIALRIIPYLVAILVAIGMFSFPMLRALGAQGLEFVLALTVGLLVYLLVDMTFDGLEIADRASSIYGNQLLVIIPGLLTLMALQSLSSLSNVRDGARIAMLIAIGIGLHNFGEGLVIGASFATNKAALGLFLVVGFTLHNITEGVGLVAPLTAEKVRWHLFLILAFVAGLPAVPGIWVGAYSFAPHWAAIYFGVGAGAIAQVVVEINRFVQIERDPQSARTRFSRISVSGYCAGAGLMYGTALLISV